MEWFEVDKGLSDAIAEIDTGTPRSAAILSGAIVESRLETALKQSFHRDTKMTDELFGISGAIGSFSTKVKLGFLIGMYSLKARKELETITKIRNLFAHKLDVINFDGQQIKAMANNLTLCYTESFTITNLVPRTKNTLLTLTYNPPTNKDGSAREQYVNACKFYMAIFTMYLRGGLRMPTPFM